MLCHGSRAHSLCVLMTAVSRCRGLGIRRSSSSQSGGRAQSSPAKLHSMSQSEYDMNEFDGGDDIAPLDTAAHSQSYVTAWGAEDSSSYDDPVPQLSIYSSASGLTMEGEGVFERPDIAEAYQRSVTEKSNKGIAVQRTLVGSKISVTATDEMLFS